MDTIQSIVQIYENYSGSSCLIALALVALLYLWLTEEDKSVRCGLIYMSVSMLLIFFLPVYAYVVMHFLLEEALYYRMLWYVPMSGLIAYAAVRVIIRAKTVVRRVVTGIAFLLILAGTGSCVFTDGTYTRAQNAYHLPREVIEVADILHREDTKAYAVLPPEFVQFIRQYDTQICLVYGRASLVEGWNDGNEVYDLMIAPVYDIDQIQYHTRKNSGGCFVLDNRKAMSGDPHDYGFTLVAVVGNYNVYIMNDFIEAYYPEYLELIQ